jgi:hypothetical protein
MIKLFYYMFHDESGEMHIDTFNNEKDLKEFLDLYGSAIEIFDIR